jgi:lipid-A-disaccharide synthase-like uncharacterized protein
MMLFTKLAFTDFLWLMFGFAGQLLFSFRFIIQWWKSEKVRKSIIPEAFWYFSLLGGITLLIYAIHIHDPVIITGQLLGVLVYLRNLYFIKQEKNQLRAAEAVSS